MWRFALALEFWSLSILPHTCSSKQPSSNKTRLIQLLNSICMLRSEMSQTQLDSTCWSKLVRHSRRSNIRNSNSWSDFLRSRKSINLRRQEQPPAPNEDLTKDTLERNWNHMLENWRECGFVVRPSWTRLLTWPSTNFPLFSNSSLHRSILCETKAKDASSNVYPKNRHLR